MKHIFIVNSHITFYMALSVQKYLNIEKNILYIFDRKYFNRLHPEIKGQDISKILNKRILSNNSGFLKHYYRLKAYREASTWIEKNIQAPFCLYTNYFPIAARIFYFHPLCRNTSFFEEGTSCYEKYLHQKPYPLKKKAARKFKLLNFLSWGRLTSFELQGDTANMKPRLAYTLHKNGFRYVHSIQARVIRFYKEKNLGKKIHIPPNNSSIIIIGKDIIMHENIDIPYYLPILKKIWEKMFLAAKGNNNVYLKTHPDISDEIASIQLKLLKKLSMKVEFIDSAIPLEQIFLQGRTYTVIGLMSSLLFYAKLFNKKNKIISFQEEFETHLKKKDKKAFSFSHKPWLQFAIGKNKEF